MICVSIGHSRHKMMMAEHRALAEQGAELVELRLDWLARLPKLDRLLRDRPTPVVVTCRRKSDGGRWPETEEQRLTLIRAAIVAGVDYIDLEDDIAAGIPRYGETKRIVSHHNLDETPDDLEAIHGRMAELDPDIIKLVTMAKSPSDVVRLLKLVKTSSAPTVGFCLGDLGVASRILCGRYGAPFTYATARRQRRVVPGQLAFQEMKDVYRYDGINDETQVFGVLGTGVTTEELCLFAHNAAFGQLGLNCVCVPLQTSEDDVDSTFAALDWLGITACSIVGCQTGRALQKADVWNGMVEDFRATNTVMRDEQGRWQAIDTISDAALDCLRHALIADSSGNMVETTNVEVNLEGKRVLILGAGASAHAIGGGLHQAGADVTLSNRTHARAIALAERLGCRQVPWTDRDLVDADILINCTPVGGPPHTEDTPFVARFLEPEVLVFDTVYPPKQTLLIESAREVGCATICGVELLVRQLAMQFEQFAGQPAPCEVMRDVLTDH